ncbi:MAG TPA: cupin domain-containing protein [Planctomycetota bacterium]|nr:cupin domain-containing protein [Planctomycetota bacterium]
MTPRAAELIANLALAPHPEGGFFREVHRSAAPVRPGDGRPERAALTVIYFLLAAGQASRWHRVASDEAWHFLEGDPLELYEADADFTRVATTTLGPFAPGSAAPVHVVGAGRWQAARSTGGYTLVACTVGPGFDFADFEMLRDRPAEADALRSVQPAFAGLV